MDNVLKALDYIPASSTSYAEWIMIGQALKEEGYPCSVWDDWSRNDSRYKPGECERKWRSFNGSSNPIKGGSIVQMAKDRGWSPVYEYSNGVMEWDDVIEYDGDGITFETETTLTPAEQLITYLKTLFKDDEYVGYVTNDVWQDSDGKYMPSKGVYDRTAKELIQLLEKHKDDLGAVVGDAKPECGAWIRFNPVDGKGHDGWWLHGRLLQLHVGRGARRRCL